MPSSPLESCVDSDAVQRMLEWTAGIPEYDTHHAVDGLFHATGFRPDESPRNDRGFLLALDFSFWFWIDDRTDRHLDGTDTPVDWERLISVAKGDVAVDPTASPEEAFFHRLSLTLEAAAQCEAEHRWWRHTAGTVFRGMHFEEQVSQGHHVPSYGESLDFGAASTAIPNLLATAALVFSMDRCQRFDDMALADVERQFAIQQRLLNDLNSSEKERKEGTMGRVSNLVLLMERSLPPQSARAFVENELAGHERLLQEALQHLSPGDRVRQLVSNALENIRQWYAKQPKRYAAPESP